MIGSYFAFFYKLRVSGHLAEYHQNLTLTPKKRNYEMIPEIDDGFYGITIRNSKLFNLERTRSKNVKGEADHVSSTDG